MTIKPVAQSFLIGLILVMACKAQPQNHGDDPVRVEEFVVTVIGLFIAGRNITKNNGY